jgi:hypothetical protein
LLTPQSAWSYEGKEGLLIVRTRGAIFGRWKYTHGYLYAHIKSLRKAEALVKEILIQEGNGGSSVVW